MLKLESIADVPNAIPRETRTMETAKRDQEAKNRLNVLKGRRKGLDGEGKDGFRVPDTKDYRKTLKIK